MEFDTKKIIGWGRDNWIPIALLALVIVFSVHSRLTNSMDTRLSGMDPYFYTQWAERLVDNGMVLPEWNEFSHYPPGRPTIDAWPLWSYIMAYWYLANMAVNPSVSLISVAHYIPAYFIVVVILSAFLLGRKVSGSGYGGVISAFFVSFAVMFLSRTSNGFADSDGLVFALSFLTAYTTIRAIESPRMHNIGLAVLTYFLFTQAWSQPFWVYLFFLATIPILFGVRLIEGMRDETPFDWGEFKRAFLVLVAIGLVSSALTIPFNSNHIVSSIGVGLNFMGGESLIVNRSIAELSAVGGGIWDNIINNTQWMVWFALLGSLPVVGYMFYKKERIGFDKVFLLVWFFGTVYMSTLGTRFILFVTMSATPMVAFVVVKGFKQLPKRLNRSQFFTAAVVAFFMYFSFVHVLDVYSYAQATQYSGLSQNWVDAMEWLGNNTEGRIGVYTYWDYGHCISWSGNKDSNFHNMFDGAQGLIQYTYPYNHNERIQDSGKMFATSNETLAVELLDKYNGLSPKLCEEARLHYRETFGIEMPEEDCAPLDEVYFIASSDLISKFPWLSYFGSFEDKEFVYEPASLQDIYEHPGNCIIEGQETIVWCPWVMQADEQGQFQRGEYVFEFLETENGSIPIVTTPMTAAIVDTVIYNNMGFDFSWYNPGRSHDKGMIYVAGNSILYVPEAIKDSVFIRAFLFNGQGLEHFEYVYGNDEVKLFRVKFGTLNIFI